jgi:uncharacterized membrane protein (GlpM family)
MYYNSNIYYTDWRQAMHFIIKTVISALIISLVSEVSKKYPFFGGIIVSLPVTSILALMWLYTDTGDKNKVVDLSNSIALMIIPSLVFFISFSILIRHNVRIQYSLILSSIIMAAAYTLYTIILKRAGIHF